MTRIDFYLLPTASQRPEDSAAIVCRLCEKATDAAQHVYVNSPEPDMGNLVDDSLWSFKQGSFISHERYTGEVNAAAGEALPMVLIGSAPPPPSHQAVLINLGSEAPAFFSQFERMLEIVPGNAAARAAARKRYRFYKDRGYPLDTHELDTPKTRHGG